MVILPLGSADPRAALIHFMIYLVGPAFYRSPPRIRALYHRRNVEGTHVIHDARECVVLLSRNRIEPIGQLVKVKHTERLRFERNFHDIAVVACSV